MGYYSNKMTLNMEYWKKEIGFSRRYKRFKIEVFGVK